MQGSRFPSDVNANREWRPTPLGANPFYKKYHLFIYLFIIRVASLTAGLTCDMSQYRTLVGPLLGTELNCDSASH